MSLNGAFEAAALGLWGPSGGLEVGIGEQKVISEKKHHRGSYQVYTKLPGIQKANQGL